MPQVIAVSERQRSPRLKKKIGSQNQGDEEKTRERIGQGKGTERLTAEAQAILELLAARFLARDAL